MSPRSAIIRDFRDDDLPAILDVQARCPLAAQWRSEQYASLVGRANSILLVADLVEEHKPSFGQGLDHRMQDAAGVPLAGFVAFRRLVDEAELENLAVLPQYHRQGIARRLVVAGHEKLRREGEKRVFLEVRSSNVPALSLYASIGYKQTQVRKGYYRDPDEDARVLCFML